MSIQRARWLLRFATVLLLLLSAGVVAWSFLGHHTLGDHAGALAVANHAAAQRTKLIRSPPLNDFAKFWRRDLRRPLYDPPPAPKEKKQTSRPGPCGAAVSGMAGLRGPLPGDLMGGSTSKSAIIRVEQVGVNKIENRFQDSAMPDPLVRPHGRKSGTRGDRAPSLPTTRRRLGSTAARGGRCAARGLRMRARYGLRSASLSLRFS